jgi:arylformamidase
MTRRIVEFSYLIGKKETVMPGTIRPPVVRARSRMVERPEGLGETETRWGSYNSTSYIEMCTHTGTHIDAPFHIDPQGLTVDAFEIEEFIFDNPLLIKLPKGDLEKITKEDLSVYKKDLKGRDLLLVYTGFSEYRKSDPERYQQKQPGFSVEGAKYLVANFSLRAVSVDLMGIENIGEAKPDFPVHKIFLKNGKRFFLMEDANLAAISAEKLIRVYIIPLRVKDAEAMPVRAFAEVEK